MRKTTSALTGLTGLLLPIAAVGALSVMSPAQAAGETCDGRPATIVVTFDPTSYVIVPVVGTPGDDVIVGTSRPDIIDGAGGNDVICGLGGYDQLTGGEGDDRLFGGLDQDYSYDDGYFGDLLVPGPGDDYVDVGADLDSLNLCECDSPETTDRISYAGATAGVDVNLETGLATGEGRDTLVVGGAVGVIGSPYDDRIVGTEEMNVIKAGAGKDKVQSGDGEDWIWLDEDDGRSFTTGAKDTLDAGAGQDYLLFSGGDHIVAGPGDDRVNGRSEVRGSVFGGGGNDVITVMGPESMAVDGGNGKDIIGAAYTGRGTYALDGGAGRDRMYLRVRAAIPTGPIQVNLGKNRMSVAGHRASVRLAGVESLTVRGLGKKRSHVTFVGSDRADNFSVLNATLRAFGRGGKDTLNGGPGNDLLNGGAGRDTLTGSLGRDRCLGGEETTGCEMRR